MEVREVCALASFLACAAGWVIVMVTCATYGDRRK